MTEDGDSLTFWSLVEFMKSCELDELWPDWPRSLFTASPVSWRLRPCGHSSLSASAGPRDAPPGRRRRAPSNGHTPAQFWRPRGTWGTHWPHPPQADRHRRGWHSLTTRGSCGQSRGGGWPGPQCAGQRPLQPPTSSLLRSLRPGTVWGRQKTDIQVGQHHKIVHYLINVMFRHPLFPLLALLFEKCELATQSAECPSSDSFNVDIQAFVQHQQQEKRPLLAESEEANELVSSNWNSASAASKISNKYSTI